MLSKFSIMLINKCRRIIYDFDDEASGIEELSVGASSWRTGNLAFHSHFHTGALSRPGCIVLSGFSTIRSM